MTTYQTSILTEDDLAAELSAARRNTAHLLSQIRDFTVIEHDQPWLHLDDLLAELRAASTTVATLERLQAVS